MSDEPDVSIIICTRNRAASLGGTLKSLAAIRSAHSWEVLVVDNASTDNTAEVLAAADDCGGRLRLLTERRVGLGAGRDGAWKQARGRIICFTDDDCYLAPDYVDAIVETFRRRPSIGCLGGRIMLYDPDDAPVTIDERDQPTEIPPYRFFPAGGLHGANLSFRRETLERSGGFDPNLGSGTVFPCEDTDAVAAALWSGVPAGFDPAPVVFHHHKRREADLGKLFEAYDRGRGTYYAKYILRKDSRPTYVRAWIDSTRPYDRAADLVRLRREFAAACDYMRFRKSGAMLALLRAVFAVVYARAWLQVAFWTTRRTVSRLARRMLGLPPPRPLA